MRSLTRPRLSATIRLSPRQRPPPRPNLLRRQPTASPAARAGGHGALATANRQTDFAKAKTARRKPGGFYLCASSRTRRPLPRGDRCLDAGWIDLLVEIGVQLVAIKLAFPPRHHHAGDAVAAKVRQRAAFAHELVDAKDDCHARNQAWIDHGKRRRQRDEAGPGNAGRPLRGQHGDQKDRDLLSETEIETERLRDEQGRE